MLDGTKRHVEFAGAADRLLVLARTPEGPTFLLVDPTADGLELTQQMTISSDTQYRLDLAGVRVEARRRWSAGPGDAWATWDAVMHDGIVLLAAQAVGGCAARARDHQPVRARTASSSASRWARSSRWRTTCRTRSPPSTAPRRWCGRRPGRASEGRPTATLAPMAKLFACQTFRDTTATAQQIFGGVGFTLEYDIQLYFRRAKQLQISWWNDRYLEELIAAQVLDARAG